MEEISGGVSSVSLYISLNKLHTIPTRTFFKHVFTCFSKEEETQLVQERVDSLRIRYSVMSLGSADVLQRLEQALEASSRCTSSQEDLHLWLGRIERELLVPAAQSQTGDTVLCSAERQKVRDTWIIALSFIWPCHNLITYTRHRSGPLWPV